MIVETNRLELHLSGTALPVGEIGFTDLAAISRALQDLTTRLSRLAVGQDGTGRTLDAAAKVASLRLRGVAAGSVVLHIARGAEDTLAGTDQLASDIDDRFWEVVRAVRDRTPPRWIPAPVAESALALIDALEHAATTATFRSVGSDRQVALRTHELDRGPWRALTLTQPSDDIAVEGRLEAVDLRSHKFRIRDDVGNAIPLENVQSPVSTAALINQRVLAEGVAIRTSDGRLRSVDVVEIRPAPLPAEWSAEPTPDLNVEFAKPGPGYDGVDGLTESDVADFLARLHA